LENGVNKKCELAGRVAEVVEHHLVHTGPEFKPQYHYQNICVYYPFVKNAKQGVHVEIRHFMGSLLLEFKIP
jgi:hypothetical protein